MARTQDLVDDLRTILADTEKLLSDTAEVGNDVGRTASARISANLETVRNKLAETHELVAGKADYAYKATDGYVRANPWESLGIAAGIGFLAGLLVCRR
ncbi:DUF883 family protein [Silvimonas sp. JCM 19000]